MRISARTTVTFGRSADFPFVSSLAIATKDEWRDILNGKLKLPLAGAYVAMVSKEAPKFDQSGEKKPPKAKNFIRDSTPAYTSDGFERPDDSCSLQRLPVRARCPIEFDRWCSPASKSSTPQHFVVSVSDESSVNMEKDPIGA